jgi:hypothetical protein
MEDAQKFVTSAEAHCRAFFEQQSPFPHIPFVHCTITLHTLQQSACELPPDEHFLAFKNRNTDHT